MCTHIVAKWISFVWEAEFSKKFHDWCATRMKKDEKLGEKKKKVKKLNIHTECYVPQSKTYGAIINRWYPAHVKASVKFHVHSHGIIENDHANGICWYILNICRFNAISSNIPFTWNSNHRHKLATVYIAATESTKMIVQAWVCSAAFFW